MDNSLHLTVINPDGSFNCDLVADHRTDVRWVGEGYVAWQAVRLRWWDDASYIAYQAGDIDDPEDGGEEASAVVPAQEIPAVDADPLPF